MKSHSKTLVAALLAAVVAVPALADKGGTGRSKHDDNHVVLLEREDHRACPPGLAKKHNGCLPPGQAKKDRVVVGEALPPDAVFVVPHRVRSTLPPPPYGYRYAVVNNQVVLVSDRNIVVDIVLRNLLG
jgi:Ni/Co efflux regulator RcnB